MIDMFDIAAIALQITLLIIMLGSLLAFIDMCFDGCIRAGKAFLLLLIAGLCVYGLNSMTGY